MIKGIFFSVTASLGFGVVYYLSTVLRPIEGSQLFGVRTLVTLPFVLFAIVLLHKQQEFIEFLKRIKKTTALNRHYCFGWSEYGFANVVVFVCPRERQSH